MLSAAKSSISQKKHEIWCESPQSQYRCLVWVLILLVFFFKKMLCAWRKTLLHRFPFHDIWFRVLSTSNSILASEASQLTLQMTTGVLCTGRLLVWIWRPPPLNGYSPFAFPDPFSTLLTRCTLGFLLCGAYLVIQRYNQQATEAGKREGLGVYTPSLQAASTVAAIFWGCATRKHGSFLQLNFYKVSVDSPFPCFFFFFDQD